MIIPIDEDWRIKSDLCCWHIQRYRGLDKKDKPVWKSEKYLNTLPRALKELANLKIRLHNSKTLEDGVKFINSIEKDFQALLVEIER